MKKAQKRRVFSFDTEDDSKGKVLLYNFYDIRNKTHHTFRDQLSALDFVCSKVSSYFWATNLEYDINNLFRGHYGMLHYCFAGSKLIFADLKQDKIRFLDTLNHWKISVAEMGNKIGLKKLEMDHGKQNTRITKKFIDYCRRDTEITGKYLALMEAKYRKVGAELKTTIAASALNFFESEYYGKIQHPFEEHQIDFMHMGYYGGRTEIFHNRPVEGNIYYHDINSLYPFALHCGIYPNLDNFSDSKTMELDFEGMCSVEITAPKDLEIPYLPAKIDGKLVFPLGNWQGVYTNFELRRAIELGYEVTKVYRAITFYDTFNPFSEFIDKLYKSRLKAKESKDELLATVYKDLMNHCYGKFAQKNESIKLIPFSEVDELKNGDTLFGDLVFRKQKTKYPRFANCIWAAYTTAFARDILWKNLQKTKEKGGMLLYCDTDSIIYESGKQLLEDSKKLGEFKLEKIWSYAHFKLPKLYCLKDETDVLYRAKGVPKKVANDFFETGKAKFKKPNKLRETLRRNLSPKRIHKLIPNYWEEREKEIHGKYEKRIVLPDGSTKPIVLINGVINKNK